MKRVLYAALLMLSSLAAAAPTPNHAPAKPRVPLPDPLPAPVHAVG